MDGSEATFADFVTRCFPPGRMATFVGAGGKSSGMRADAGVLSRRGLRVRITTTTRIGVEEFSSLPVAFVRSESDLLDSLASETAVEVISAGILGAQQKHMGVEPSLLGRVSLPDDLVLLVEGDGARRMPVKAPRAHEPVIPDGSAAVFALMGAAAFGEPVDSRSCCNPEGVLAVLGVRSGVFDAAALALLADSANGCRKGVLPGMSFHLVVNQGDLAERRQIAHELLSRLRESLISSTLLSWREQRVYETAWR
jgi:probable selenium-dependent hydroxylase accessory protein YqeC